MRSTGLLVLFQVFMPAAGGARAQDVTTVSTFHSISLYWEPAAPQ
jgi:hypothetical protein